MEGFRGCTCDTLSGPCTAATGRRGSRHKHVELIAHAAFLLSDHVLPLVGTYGGPCLPPSKP